MRCFMWKFLIFGSANKSGVLTRAVISFTRSSGPENWKLRKGHHNVVRLFELPNERWNGTYLSAPEGTWDFGFPTWDDESHLQAGDFSSTFWAVRT
jgi:hypothetical protein